MIETSCYERGCVRGPHQQKHSPVVVQAAGDGRALPARADCIPPTTYNGSADLKAQVRSTSQVSSSVSVSPATCAIDSCSKQRPAAETRRGVSQYARRSLTLRTSVAGRSRWQSSQPASRLLLMETSATDQINSTGIRGVEVSRAHVRRGRFALRKCSTPPRTLPAPPILLPQIVRTQSWPRTSPSPVKTPKIRAYQPILQATRVSSTATALNRAKERRPEPASLHRLRFASKSSFGLPSAPATRPQI